MSITRLSSTVVLTLALAVALGTTASGNHSWGPYHWARQQSEFTLTVVNSTTNGWGSYVANALSDWSQSRVVDLVPVAGSTSSRDRRQCRPPAGQVRICNLEYGYNGWLGIAGISVDQDGHILYGYTKLNDSYFNSGFYNNGAWKQSVTCQELGHDLGLDHQDEDFNNETLETCMDYQNPPWQFPNAHDYAQLETIYGHLDDYDSYETAGAGGDPGGGEEGGGTCNAPPGKGCNKGTVGQSNEPYGWGISLGRRGPHETFIRIEPDGTRHITHVTWAEIQ